MEDNTNRMVSLNDTNCFLWKKGKSKEKDHDDDRVTTTTSDDLVILRDFESVNFVSDERMWIIDSGAILHVTSRKEFFTSYTASDFGVLKMGIDGVTKVIGVGDVCLQTNTGMQLWPRGVKHALDVRLNLIFVRMLDDGNYDNHFGHGKWKLTKGNLVVARGEKNSKLYWTKALVAKDSVNVMDMEASLWHRRLSHISEKGLNCLAKKDMFTGLKNAELEKCSHCMASKQARVSFKKYPPSRKSELLESMHYDVCDPLKVKSFSGALYLVTFIDDYSRKLWVYVLKTKDQVLEKFKQFQTLVERQSSKKVKCIRSDNVTLNIEVSNKIWFDKDVKYDHLRVFGSKNGDQHNYVGDQQLGDGFDVPPGDDVEEEQEMYRWIHDALDAKLLELVKVHTDDTSANMMIKVVPRWKFEACCEIVGLAITST
ncbi:hypothetical protein CR513_13840, partial [Mucuna pruriens]